MAQPDEFVGTSLVSFEDAVLSALPPPTSNVPRDFTIVQFSVEVGGFVGIPQYRAAVRRG